MERSVWSVFSDQLSVSCDYVVTYNFANPNKAGLFEGSFSGGWVNLTPSLIFQEELIYNQHNFIQLLNNQFIVVG